MREIKFRAMYKNNNGLSGKLKLKKWEYGSVKDVDFPEFWGGLQEDCNDYPLDIKTLGQFTGLKDKNGKEIYEGDIVKISYPNEEEESIHQVQYQVDRDYPAFDLDPYLDVDSNGLSHIIATGIIEVIGNIYENPELLK